VPEGLGTALRYFRENQPDGARLRARAAGHATCRVCLDGSGSPGTRGYPAAKQLRCSRRARDNASGPHYALATMNWLLDGGHRRR